MNSKLERLFTILQNAGYKGKDVTKTFSGKQKNSRVNSQASKERMKSKLNFVLDIFNNAGYEVKDESKTFFRQREKLSGEVASLRTKVSTVSKKGAHCAYT